MPFRNRTTPASIDTPETNGLAMGRRGFLASALGGLSIAFIMPDVGRIFGVQSASPPTPHQLANAYINIGTDGSITLMFGGSEMGQVTRDVGAQAIKRGSAFQNVAGPYGEVGGVGPLAYRP